MPFELDYDKLIHLDAEGLAETGIKAAYEGLWPELRALGVEPLGVEEVIDPDLPRYAVVGGGAEQVVYEPGLGDDLEQSWGRASYILFSLVNSQLSESPVRFYAINGGNDLGGMFLTTADVERARAALPRKADWPYLPTLDPPWYGQEH